MKPKLAFTLVLILLLTGLLVACGDSTATIAPTTSAATTAAGATTTAAGTSATTTAGTGSTTAAGTNAAPAGAATTGVLTMPQGTTTFQRNFNPLLLVPSTQRSMVFTSR